MTRLTPKLELLRLEGVLGLALDFTLGSLLDLSGNGNTPSTFAGSWVWRRTAKGLGISPDNTSAILSDGTSATMDLTTSGTLMWAWYQYQPISGVAKGLFYKSAGWGTLLNGWSVYLAVSPTVSLGDGSAFQTISSTRTSDSLLGQLSFGLMTWGATTGRWYINGVPETPITRTRTPSPVGQTLRFANTTGLGYTLSQVAVVRREVSMTEAAELYEDFLDHTYLPAPPRNFYYRYPTGDCLSDTSIKLDTDFGSEMNGATRRIREFTGAYPGTITGVLPDGPNGEGATVPVLASEVSFGNVTAFNSVTAFTVEFVVDLPAGTIPNSYFCIKYVSPTSNVSIGCSGGGAVSPKSLYFYVSNGVGTYAQTQAACYLRGGCQHHLIVSYNGLGGALAKASVYVDGVSAVLDYPAGDLPASTAALAVNWALGYTFACPCTHKMQRVYNRVLTPVQARSAYLKWAQRIALQIPGEHLPVTLGTSTTELAPWRAVSGTWKISEDSAGRRWLECVTGVGHCVAPMPFMIGTRTLKVMKVSVANAARIGWLSWDTAIGTVVAGQNGYFVGIDAALSMRLTRVTNGTGAATLWSTAAGYLAASTIYEIDIALRPSDCRYSTWVKGGAYATPTVPSAPVADATYTTCAWLHFQADVGDKLLIHDPAVNSCPNRIFSGVLDPTAGELL